MVTYESTRRPRQRKTWVQGLAILLGYVPAVIISVANQAGGQGVTLQGILTYTTLGAGILIAAILLLLWFVCGETPKALNLKSSAWWKDLLGGGVLVGLTLLAKYALDPAIGQYFQRASASQSGLGNLFAELATNPLFLVLFLGPALLIGVAGFEELSRVFFITRWMKLSSAKLWLGVGVVLSAVLFGLVHLYQGPAGAVSVTLNGLIMAAWYLRFGRIFQLIAAHYLYDAVQFGMVLILIWNGTIQM